MSTTFDTLILGGELIDGRGGAPVVGDIGIQGDRITAIGHLHNATAAQRLDARGLAVAPGFIDIHTHSDFTLLVDGSADSQICQGVTTEVIGQCGFSAAPMGDVADASHLIGHVEAGVALNWRSFGDYLQRLQDAQPAVNVAAFVGHGAFHRAAGMGGLAQMERLAEEAFDDGAIGLSTGLEYWPGSEAPEAEIEALARVAARRGGLYATHVRNRDADCGLGFAEAIRTARRAGARLKDGTQRERMKHNTRPIWRLVTERCWDRIVLLRSVANPQLVGLDFEHIGRLRGVDPHDAAFDLLLEEGTGLEQLMWTSRNFDDADVCLCLQQAQCSVISDTLAVSRHGPLKDVIGSLSGYGWTARLLGHHARDRGLLRLSEAVARITGRPAERLGLVDRGLLRENAFADIVVLDPKRVQDVASFVQPAVHPKGFVHVWVNGQQVVNDGVRNAQRPGRVWRGSSHARSRQQPSQGST